MAQPLQGLGRQGRAATKKGETSSQEVLRAAADAFLSRGYAATSMDDIADLLGCTKGRIYHYFRSKGEIYLGIHRLALEASFEKVAPCADSDEPAKTRLFNMARAHAMLMMHEHGFMRLAMVHVEMNLAREGRTREESVREIVRMRRRYQELFETVIHDGIETGDFRPCDSAVMAKAVLGSLNWISVWFRSPNETGPSIEPTTIAQQYAEFVTNGLRKI